MNKEQRRARKTAKANKHRASYILRRDAVKRGNQILKTSLRNAFMYAKFQARLAREDAQLKKI